jgi:hypothetical protein
MESGRLRGTDCRNRKPNRLRRNDLTIGITRVQNERKPSVFWRFLGMF